MNGGVMRILPKDIHTLPEINNINADSTKFTEIIRLFEFLLKIVGPHGAPDITLGKRVKANEHLFPSEDIWLVVERRNNYQHGTEEIDGVKIGNAISILSSEISLLLQDLPPGCEKLRNEIESGERQPEFPSEILKTLPEIDGESDFDKIVHLGELMQFMLRKIDPYTNGLLSHVVEVNATLFQDEQYVFKGAKTWERLQTATQKQLLRGEARAIDQLSKGIADLLSSKRLSPTLSAAIEGQHGNVSDPANVEIPPVQEKDEPHYPSNFDNTLQDDFLPSFAQIEPTATWLPYTSKVFRIFLVACLGVAVVGGILALNGKKNPNLSPLSTPTPVNIEVEASQARLRAYTAYDLIKKINLKTSSRAEIEKKLQAAESLFQKGEYQNASTAFQNAEERIKVIMNQINPSLSPSPSPTQENIVPPSPSPISSLDNIAPSITPMPKPTIPLPTLTPTSLPTTERVIVLNGRGFDRPAHGYGPQFTTEEINLSPGMILEITVTGKIKLNQTGKKTNADGFKDSKPKNQVFLKPEEPLGKVIGLTKYRGKIFYTVPIGSKCTYVAEGEGKLWLGINDDKMDDNGKANETGNEFIVTVKITSR